MRGDIGKSARRLEIRMGDVLGAGQSRRVAVAMEGSPGEASVLGLAAFIV
jgi:hypothetical protein